MMQIGETEAQKPNPSEKAAQAEADLKLAEQVLNSVADQWKDALLQAKELDEDTNEKYRAHFDGAANDFRDAFNAFIIAQKEEMSEIVRKWSAE
ncbi:MAG: hypothetical protein Q7S28_03100, partial [bacterium]|nr:hypothetical protein [bacterium]